MESRHGVWKRTREIQIILLIIAVFAGGFIFGSQYSISTAQSGGTSLSQEAEAAFEPLFQTYNLIQSQYIDPAETSALVDGAISGMVGVLGDPNTVYIEPELAPFVDSSLAGEIEGIGAVIREIEDAGEVEIITVLPDTPAQRAGLRAGDVFITVNGEDVLGLTTLQVAARVRGPVGTIVDLVMRRDGELIEFSIERARIQLIEVEYRMLENNIGYIRLASFGVNARRQLDGAFADLGVDNLNGLIFDLRGNTGGYLNSGLEVASLFIDNGVLLIEDFGNGEERIFKAQNDQIIQIFDDGTERVYSSSAAYVGVTAPIVVLVDRASASASELVVGAWQENGAVTVIGTTTFGKGTVQQVNTLVNGGSLRLTIARWLTPNRVSIHGAGITPDIVIEIPQDVELAEGEDPTLDAALEFLETRMVPESD